MNYPPNLSVEKIRKIKEIEDQISKVCIEESMCRSDKEIDMFAEYIEFLEQHIQDIIHDYDKFYENTDSSMIDNLDATRKIDKTGESNKRVSSKNKTIDNKHSLNSDTHLKKESVAGNEISNISESRGGRIPYSYKPKAEKW